MMAKNPILTTMKSLGTRVASDRFASAAGPHDPTDYEPPELDGPGPMGNQIPFEGSKEGTSLDVWPPRTLDRCL